MKTPPAAFEWFLEGIDPSLQQMWRIALTRFPCRIGRRSDLEIALPSPQVSLEHAAILRGAGGLSIRDLGSRNGTFLNGRRLDAESPLSEGDILHFAAIEFRLGRLSDASDLGLLETTTPSSSPLALPPERSRIEELRWLRELLDERRVVSLFQPIVLLPSGRRMGCEALGAGTDERLPRSAGELYTIAARTGLAGELTATLRADALRLASRLPAEDLLFLNVDSSEREPAKLLADFADVRRRHPSLRAVVEISERLAMTVDRLRTVRDGLAALDMGLAYDDFGAGLARLRELVEVPPQFVKFDIDLVRDIDRAEPERRRFVATLVEAARDLGAQVVAEGIERASEAACCAELGFTHAQGFFFGRPAPLAEVGAP